MNLVSSELNKIADRGVFKILSNVYDGAFSSEPFSKKINHGP